MSRALAQSLGLLLFAAAALAQEQGGGEGEGSSKDNLRIAHGVIAALAWVIFFPLGAILIRVINSSSAWWIHASVQAFSIILMTVAAATGIALAEGDQLSEYHPVIGLILFSVIFLQALGGIIHHLLFRKKHRRTVISHVHIWLGRILITLGMINGGLGLMFAHDANVGRSVAYGVVAGVIWLTYVGVAVSSSLKSRRAPAYKHEIKADRTGTDYE